MWDANTTSLNNRQKSAYPSDVFAQKKDTSFALHFGESSWDDRHADAMLSKSMDELSDQYVKNFAWRQYMCNYYQTDSTRKWL